MLQLKDVPKTSLYGIPFSKLNMQQTMKLLVSHINQGHYLQVITANPIMVMTALKNDKYMNLMKKADLIVPDGIGIVWAAAKLGNPVCERITGFDLLHELMKEGQLYKWKVYLLGAAPHVVQATAKILQQQYPFTFIVGYKDGFFNSDKDEEIIARIREADPDLLFVARGIETQDPWIAKYRHQLQVPLMIGVGGSFNVIAGKCKRAPIWVQNLGMEWLYRLMKEPKRLKRMLVLPKFAWKVMQDADRLTKVQKNNK